MKYDHTALNPNFVRLLIIGAAFLTVTLVLILLQPSGSSSLPEPQGFAEATETSDENLVARAETDLMSLTSSAPATSAPATAPAEAPAVADPLTASVLASLSGETPAPAPSIAPSVEALAPSDDDPLRSLTSGVLASLGGNAPATDAPKSMEQIIVQALKQGQSDAYIDALLNEAANTGSITVPVALRTEAGRVDTGTLLADLVAKSNPKAETALSTPSLSNSGVEVRVVQRGDETVKYHFYTVQKGDSLGAIAHRFYGDAALYSAIFEANRQLLSSPDRVRAGQRLSIPEVSQG